MYKLLPALFLAVVPLIAEDAPPKAAAIATVQKLFDAMKAKDAEAIRALVLPGTSFAALRPNGQTTVTTVEKFAENIARAQGELVERMWDPTVRIEGNLAILSAPYDFHRDGKLTHCGIDAATLLKTAEGWKIATLSYTIITEGITERCVAPKK